jgi:ribosome modulation factor
MEPNKYFEEGKNAALKGISQHENPYKTDKEKRKSWIEGWRSGAREMFENLPAEERVKYWEGKWKQSELERYILIRHAIPFTTMVDGIEEDRIVWESKDGKTKIRSSQVVDLLNAIYKYQTADIDEIKEYCEKQEKIFLEKRKDI